MSVEENNDKPINVIEVQSEIPEEEPIEKVFSQEPEDVVTVEPSIESEDQERFEETAKFEEALDSTKLQEHEPQQPKSRKSKVTKKSPTRDVDRSVSQLQNELKKHSDARKKTDSAILDIRKELKDLLLIHHATIKDLQKQVAQMHKKIATVDSFKKSAKVKTTAKKITRNKKTSSKKPIKKSGQRKGRKVRQQVAN